MDTRTCPQCGTPYGKRARCYVCQPGKQRTGEQRTCRNCGQPFYVSRSAARDTARRTGTYCSNACKYAAMPRCQGHPERIQYHSAGYRLAYAPDHPRASRGRVLEHILVMEQTLGRALQPGEFVHHRDGDKQNNDPANLQLVSNAEHAAIHGISGWNRDPVECTCLECGILFTTQRYRTTTHDPRSQRKYCSLACRYRAWGRQMRAKRTAKRLRSD